MKKVFQSFIGIVSAISALATLASFIVGIYCIITMSTAFATCMIVFFISLTITFAAGIARDYY